MRKNILEIIKERSKAIHLELIEIRNHLHKYPELSYEEYNTSAFIKSILEKYGIPYTDNWVKTGIVAEVKGDLAGNSVAVRSELDALPIQELNEVAYKSVNAGVMHACGHDVHSTCLLGAAILLNELRSEIKGKIIFIFQPGEEKLPGGASLLLKQGIFENDKPKSIIAQHVYPALDAGKVGVCEGQYMASADEIYITIEGKGGHGALPHLCIDPIVIASQIILALQTLVSRSGNTLIPSVLTIGKINSEGGATNIIPNKVMLEGTFRTMDEAWRYEAHNEIRNLIEHTATAFGGKAIVDIQVGYPSLNNDRKLTNSVYLNMIEYLGEDNVVKLPQRMTSEDFSFFSNIMPACFYRLGVGNIEKGIINGVHHPKFDIDEKALEIGCGLMAWIAFNESNK